MTMSFLPSDQPSLRRLERSGLQFIVGFTSLLFSFTALGGEEWSLVSVLLGPGLLILYYILWRMTSEYPNFTVLRLTHDPEARREFPVFVKTICEENFGSNGYLPLKGGEDY